MAVAALAEGYARIADIGAGDGRLSRHLHDRGHSVIATELSRSQVERLSRAVDGTRIHILEGFGLRPLAARALDAVVLAGLGGGTLARILADRPPGADWTLILQPMQNLRPLSEALRRLNRGVSGARLVFSRGRLYPILVAPPAVCWNGGDDSLLDELGLWLASDPLWPAWIDGMQRRGEHALRRRTPATRRHVIEQHLTRLADLRAGRPADRSPVNIGAFHRATYDTLCQECAPERKRRGREGKEAPVSHHSWQGHFGPDVVSRAWPDFSAITRVVPVSTDAQEATLAAWRGTSEFLGAGVVSGSFGRARAVAHLFGGRPVGPSLIYRPYLKLAVYVPSNAVNRVRDAVTAAGAGGIGTYTHTTFASAGTGTFRPGAESTPAVGQPGQLEYADEFRLETILPQWLEDQVVHAMLAAHPYEEVAYDLIPIANRLMVPQAFLGDDGTVKTAEVTREIGAWAITTGVTRLEAERCDDRTRLELSRHGISVALVPFGTWTVPGLEATLGEVRS